MAVYRDVLLCVVVVVVCVCMCVCGGWGAGGGGEGCKARFDCMRNSATDVN